MLFRFTNCWATTGTPFLFFTSLLLDIFNSCVILDIMGWFFSSRGIVDLQCCMFQIYSKEWISYTTCICVLFFFFFLAIPTACGRSWARTYVHSFSHIGSYRVSGLHSRPLLVIYFIYNSVYVLIPSCQFIPLPNGFLFGNHKFDFKSVTLFLFCEFVFFVSFLLDSIY